MSRIQALNSASARGEAAQVLEAVQSKMGRVPNIIATMANSPAVANAYLAFSGAVAGGALPAKLREQIALIVGEENQCGYCLSAHSTLGKMSGLSDEQVLQARQANADNARDTAALQFASSLVQQRGNVTDDELSTLRAAGFSDGDIAEIVANVALNLFTNYFNHVADPEIDFPLAPALASV